MVYFSPRLIRLTIAVLASLAGLASTYLWASAVPIKPGAFKWPVGEMGAAQIAISGKQPGDGFGGTVATGDFNGDGFSDLLVGAPFLLDGIDHYSEVYLIPGPLPIGEVITVPQHTAITFWHKHYENHIGRYVDSGDFNGDGYDDVVLDLWPAGITTLYPGNQEISAENPQTVFPFRTEMALTVKRASGGVAVCNINGDGYDDLFVEDVMKDLTLGKLQVWGILGSASITFTNPMTIDLQNEGADILVRGQDLNSWGEPTERNIGCGDIDGDGVEDLAIGAFGESPGGRDGAGRVYVLRGNTSITATQPITLQMPAGAGAVIQGVDSFEYGNGDRLGQSLAVGDTNGDGHADLVVGAPGGFGPDNAISHTGEIYLWLGRDLAGQTFTIDSQAKWKLHGMYTFTGLGGRGLHTDDLDSDGMDEVLIGCTNCDGHLPYPNTSDRGFVIENNLQCGWRPAVGSASFLAYYDNSMYNFGTSTDSGDFDADSYPDMVFGAPSYGFGTPNVPGRVYIIPYPIRYKLYFPSIASMQQ